MKPAKPTILQKQNPGYRPGRNEGNDNKFKLVTDIPIPDPAFIKEERAVALWYLLCSNLISVGLLTEIGLHQLEMYVIKYQMFLMMNRAINMPDFEYTYIGKQNEIHVQPIVKTMVALQESMVKDENRWALNPAAAASLSAPLKDNNHLGGSSEKDHFGLED